MMRNERMEKSGTLILCLAIVVILAVPVQSEEVPPPPQWLLDTTRVAYTDLPNTRREQDWPEKVIEDFAAAGVQMMFSRCHGGDRWNGLGWSSKYGDIDPALKGKLSDWEVVGGEAAEGDVHSGKRCLKLVHTKDREQTYLNRRWKPRDGQQGAMLDLLKGEISYRYKCVSAKDASLWLGVVPMSADPLENTGAQRSGIQIPAGHIGDGQWHQATIPYDYTNNPKVKWVHVSCFIRGEAAELLIDDVEYLGKDPQPITNGGFEEVEPDRDGTREIVALCRRYGLRYMAYYWAQREPASVGEAHPDWRCLNSDGKPTAYYCINTPYRELVKNRIVELVKEVGVDGIFFDMFHARANECYCEACTKKFREQTGQDPPLKEDFDSLLWQEWVNFKYRSIEEAMLYFNKAIKAANPEAALMVNSWNAWAYRTAGKPEPHNIRNSIRVVECVDGLLEETGWYDTADPSFFAFPARHNFMNWHLAGLCKRKRAFMWGAPSLPGWLALRGDEPLIRVMTMMTNGAVPAHSVPGRDVLKEYMAEIARCDDYFRGARLFPWCGLVVSEKTELWYGRDDPKERYIKGIYGAFQAMLERHLPVSMVTDRELELGQLEGYRALFLPNCAAMSEAEMETVRRFVRNGGGLVATYETSFYDEHARQRNGFGLADVLKAKEVGRFDNVQMRAGWEPTTRIHNAQLHFSAEHRWSADPVILGTLAARHVNASESTISRFAPLHCRMLLVEPTEGKPSPMRLTTAHFNKNAGKVDYTNSVAIIESTYGKGKVIYLPYDITWSFFRYGHEYLGRIIELALREAASEPPPVEVEAPRIVQAMTHAQGDRLVVYLLNDISSFGRSQNVARESLYIRREVIPIHDIRVTFRDTAFRRFLLVPGGIELQAAAVEGGLRVEVPELHVHGMVVAER